ncbi:replication initiation and membrane attachment [Desulfosporosinus acididurans]|uniref:Replication initiation and membrane attachment n=1 Tax=Desulfosporosinus acididurans TaxID=476652 RepID=A0A0J1FTV9_9FIRM|nr:DnaD domain protein [Desulfosporosinus acididurans]KLU66727.1 replication initiation and membrane attachment [Desulfosporosinus acididurans]
MARARNIKPSFFANDQLGELPPLARLLFIGLWGLADRRGKLEDRPKRIKAEVLPYDDCDVNELLNLLEPEFIVRYTVDGISCIQIVNFLKHQKPHPKEAESNLPNMPEDNQAVTRCEQAAKINGKDIPKNLETQTSNLNVSTSPAESLLLNVESPIMNDDCCLPQNESADENNNATEKSENTEPNEGNMAVGTRALIWAEKNWGRMLSPGESREIMTWCDEFSTRGSQHPDDLVVEALKQCDYASVRNMKYLRAVLTDWREAGVLSVSQVEAREAERKSQKEHKRNKDPGNMPSGSPRVPSDKYEKFYL